MSATRKTMIATLSSTVIPKLAAAGFSGRFPNFRRIRGRKIDLLTFQFNRYGGSFVVEIASCPTRGKMWWGDPVDPELVTAHDLNDRLRLGSKPPKEEDHWFEFERTKKAPDYSAAADAVIACLPQAERYWRRK